MNPGTKAKTIGVILLVAVLIVAAIGVVRANTPGNTAISETSETVVRPPEILRHETLPIILKLSWCLEKGITDDERKEIEAEAQAMAKAKGLLSQVEMDRIRAGEQVAAEWRREVGTTSRFWGVRGSDMNGGGRFVGAMKLDYGRSVVAYGYVIGVDGAAPRVWVAGCEVGRATAHKRARERAREWFREEGQTLLYVEGRFTL